MLDRHMVLMLLTVFLLCGCSAEQGTSATTGTETNPTAAPILAPTVTPNLQDAADAQADSIAQPPTSAQEETSVDSAAPQPTTESAAAGAAACNVEPHLDFFGYPNFDSLQELMGCAVAEPIFEAVAINEFGEGPAFDRFMLWTSTDRMIYVLRPDNGWEVHTDTWSEEQPEIACSLDGLAFASPPLPRRGFGKLWCQSELLQETMGTIVREERSCQHAVLQQFERGQLLACFEDATYRYFRIMEDQTWESVFIQ